MLLAATFGMEGGSRDQIRTGESGEGNEIHYIYESIDLCTHLVPRHDRNKMPILGIHVVDIRVDM